MQVNRHFHTDHSFSQVTNQGTRFTERNQQSANCKSEISFHRFFMKRSFSHVFFGNKKNLCEKIIKSSVIILVPGITQTHMFQFILFKNTEVIIQELLKS